MQSDDKQLLQVSSGTLEYYEASAEAFWRGTRDHDVSQNIDELLRHIEAPAPFTILDFGCGPGRDLLSFTTLGHLAVGLEGSPSFARMARAHSGCEVLEQDFLQLDLPRARFDGVFANASLFHLPSQALPRVLGQIHDSLKPGGVLFASNPRGQDQEGWQGGRYGTYYALDTWRRHLLAAGFTELNHYFRPDNLPLAERPWLASTWRRH